MPFKNIYYGWYIVAACFLLCFLFAGAGFYSFSIFIRPIENDFGWSRSSIALTMSIYLIVSGLMSPLIGRLIQEYGPKKVMRVCAFFAGACFMLVSLTQSLWYFYLVYAFLAVCVSGMGVIPASSLLANWFDKRRGRAVGISMVGISFGGFLLAPFVGWISTNYGWKSAFLAIGLIVWAVALPVVQFIVKDKPEDGDRPQLEGAEQSPDTNQPPEPFFSAGQGWTASAALKSRPFWCIFISFFLTPMAQMGVLQHQVPIIMASGMSEAMAAAILGLTAGVGGLGKLSFGRFSEIWPFRYVALLCFGLQALAVLALICVNSVATVWFYAVIFGFAMGGVVVLIPLVVGHYWGLTSYSVLLGVVWVANSLGGSAGTYLSGLIYDHSGSYQYALYLFVSAYIISVITFFAAGKPKEMLK